RFLVAGHAASIVACSPPAAGTALGIAGQIAPALAESRGLPRHDKVYVAELDLDALQRAGVRRDETVTLLPRYPFVIRDLSIVVADSLPAEIIRGTIQAAGGIDFAPLDRLEEKVKLLVNMVERMKADQSRAADDNQRLTREIESLRGRLASSDTLSAELSALKQERDVIRTRVGEMLDQLEALNL